ncbi:MAG: protease inhibitor I42 family protein [Hyphomonadaceae bacterium]|nr:protease inhibitor I42 family protein [Hyphomonadaceae bacterium]
MHRILAAAIAAALAACAPVAEVAPSPEAKPPAMNKAVPAPTPADVPVRVTADDDGETIAVPVGGRFAVELVGVPTAGYVWQVDHRPAFLSAPQELGGATSTAQAQPGFTGGNHWEVFVFTAAGPGEGVLKLGQRRPWEDGEPPTRTFTVTVRAQ